ncbi:Lon protease C-terminal proteolytic domain-containing protein [Mycotypha africana]|uniref:Lon protease C-terminal proteolytic domain-containing protein n=1 Tax=Mycotypha africana TaxID=64632 RepID=UPI0022FFFB6A|nr:Lon protease C-terminal proteolytic domain-containing protein [Mycotypha africana]KAI8977519.1 Lon protease C-terminal proteolytic domain-containing protein [Mycotypha africana]
MSSHTFLIHVSRTIPRSKVQQVVWSQLSSSSASTPMLPMTALRSFSTHNAARSNHSITVFGAEHALQSLRQNKTHLFGLSPIRHPAALRRAAASTMQLRDRDPKDNPSSSDAPPPSSSSPNGGGSESGGGGNNGDGGQKSKKAKSVFENQQQQQQQQQQNQLQKPSVPEVYPQLLAIPIAGRPLFPGFYKAIAIKEAPVIAAIRELMKRGQPYVGAFLFKQEGVNSDTITSMDQVHTTGVFAQITSVLATPGIEESSNGVTVVLYPHRRIKMNELLPMAAPRQEKELKKSDTATAEGGTVTSLEAEKESTMDSRAAAEEPLLNEAELQQETTEGAVEKGNPYNSQYATSFLADNYAVSLVSVENCVEPELSKKSPYIRAVTSEIVSVCKEIANLNPLFKEQIANFSMSQSAGNVFEEPSKLADFAAAVSAGEAAELQEVLETLNVEDRLQKALVVLKKELLNAQLQSKISKEVDTKIAKRHREYILMEQLKGIKKELGLESDGKDKLVEGFKEKAEKLAMPATVKKVFDEEINKLVHLEPAASEFNVTRNYLDWLTQVPWGKRSQENYNIVHATKVLDEDHYGLKDVKDRILEFIAVGKLRGTVEGKILCLSGPPGVGKTSIGKSIARALDREFYRFSVGGLTDVAEIKGHRRTYVGAMPGKVIQALKKVQTENPLILIDEIDKLGRGHQGDPSSALLELLDPEQNNSFLDHYMDVPVDLSKVLFVCTANVLDTIPGPLLDRMEVIQLSGYIAEEKAAIASKYLAPTAKSAAGLEHVNVNLTPAAIDSLIKNYCRESGVRNLKKHIDKVFRKAAFKVVQQVAGKADEKNEAQINAAAAAEKTKDATPKDKQAETSTADVKVEDTKKPIKEPLPVPSDISIDITPENLKDYVGPQVFQTERLYEQTPPGVVMGLAWTSLGGSSLYIESVLESSLDPKSTPHLSKTGQLGDVMKESSSIAYTYAKSLMATHYPKNKFFDKAKLHLHCPAGAVPKDGPSAGVTMTTALLSLALNKSVPSNIAMTGELTVTGKVLKIGGLKEKTIAAKRSKVNTILFPRDNQADWDELPDYIREGLTGIPCDTYKDVFKVCFGDIKKEEAENVWSSVLTEEATSATTTEEKK